jgi:hypothetical protein
MSTGFAIDQNHIGFFQVGEPICDLNWDQDLGSNESDWNLIK